MFDLIAVGNKWYTSEALFEAIESKSACLRGLNKFNPQTASEYSKLSDDLRELNKAACNAGLVISVETRGNYNSH